MVSFFCTVKNRNTGINPFGKSYRLSVINLTVLLKEIKQHDGSDSKAKRLSTCWPNYHYLIHVLKSCHCQYLQI